MCDRKIPIVTLEFPENLSHGRTTEKKDKMPVKRKGPRKKSEFPEKLVMKQPIPKPKIPKFELPELPKMPKRPKKIYSITKKEIDEEEQYAKEWLEYSKRVSRIRFSREIIPNYDGNDNYE